MASQCESESKSKSELLKVLADLDENTAKKFLILIKELKVSTTEEEVDDVAFMPENKTYPTTRDQSERYHDSTSKSVSERELLEIRIKELNIREAELALKKEQMEIQKKQIDTDRMKIKLDEKNKFWERRDRIFSIADTMIYKRDKLFNYGASELGRGIGGLVGHHYSGSRGRHMGKTSGECIAIGGALLFTSFTRDSRVNNIVETSMKNYLEDKDVHNFYGLKDDDTIRESAVD